MFVVLQYRQLFIAMLAMFLLLLLVACSDTELNVLDPKSMGISAPLIEVYTPVSGSILPADTDFMLEFAAVRGPKGTHVKLRIDKKRPVTLAGISGKHHIDGLPAGPHTIAIKGYASDGRPTGAQVIIKVFMEKATNDD